MLDHTVKQNILQHLKEVTTEILEAMRHDENGPYWLVPYFKDESENYEFKQSQEIFNGDCGIALFFLSSYEYTQEPKHLQLARQVIDRLLRSEKAVSPQFFHFYAGITDLIYACIRLYEVIGHQFYRSKARDLTYLHQHSILERVDKFDLLTGHAGNLLVLTLVYHYHPEEAILNIIHHIIDEFIASARLSDKGLKWDHFKFAFDSMAGFSHGASGIAYALMQVGNYFKYDGLLYLAEQALAYEMQYYDKEAQNWLDLRLGPARLNIPGAHMWDINIMRPQIRDVNSWAHGAAGIGLARLYAYQITGRSEYLDQCRDIADRCKKDIAGRREDHTLCSGYGGMLPFMLKFNILEPDISLQTASIAIANEARILKHTCGTYNRFISCNFVDNGLFSGKAGIGHMLITVLTNGTLNDVTCLSLPEHPAGEDQSSVYNIRHVQFQLYSKSFRKTLSFLSINQIILLKNELTKNIEDFEAMIGKALDNLQDHEEYCIIKETFTYEKVIVQLWRQHKGSLCYAKKNEQLLQKAKYYNGEHNDHYLTYTFEICGHVKVFTGNLVYAVDDEKRQQDCYLLAYCTEKGIAEAKVGQFVFSILTTLANPTTGLELTERLANSFHSKKSAAMRSDILKEKVTQQLRELIRVGLIEIAGE